MTGKYALTQLLRKWLNFYSEYQIQPEENFEEIMSHVWMIESLFAEWTVVLCKVKHPSVPYISSNCKDLLGYSQEQMLKYTPEEFFDLIHPDDIEPVYQVYDYMKSYTRQFNFNPTDYRFVFNYRIRQENGNYLFLHDEKIAIKNKDNRFVYFTLLKSIDGEKPFRQVKMVINKVKGNQIVKLDEYIPRLKNSVITPRESEILYLIQEGLSNKEIADRLFISVNTVKNHRRNMFEKMNVKNSVELLKSLEMLKAS